MPEALMPSQSEDLLFTDGFNFQLLLARREWEQVQAESRGAQRDHILACCQRLDTAGPVVQSVDPLPTEAV